MKDSQKELDAVGGPITSTEIQPLLLITHMHTSSKGDEIATTEETNFSSMVIEMPLPARISHS